jgi:hypothetical protein
MISKPSDNFSGIDFGDKRITERTVQVVEDLTKKPQKSVNLASRSRANAKAAYRLLANENFTVDKLQDGIAQTTRSAMSGIPVVLLIQDTSDINYNTHKKTKGLGYSSENVLGIKAHSCIAVTPDGVPIGLMSQSCITREKSKNPEKDSKKVKRPIDEKESNRWLEAMRETTKNIPVGAQAITICDRECDFYEFYNEAIDIEEKFIVRVVHNRVTANNERLRSTLENMAPAGTANVYIPRDTRRNIKARTVELEISYAQITWKRPSIRKEAHIATTITFNVVRIVEKNPMDDVEAIEWILATNLDVSSAEEAFLVVQYYVERWKIERFHHVLKSGCNVEKIQQRNVERIKPLMLIYSVIALYILAMTLSARSFPDTPCDVFFDENEWKILFKAANRTTIPPKNPYKLTQAIEYLGILAGRKFSPSDGEIGAETIWQGLFALYLLVEFAPFVGQV